MKTKLILIGVILLLLLALYILVGMYSKERTERKTYQQNTSELMKDTTEKAAIIQVNKKEFRELFGKYDQLLKENNILKKDVKELHSIKYKIGSVKVAKTDTVWVPFAPQPKEDIYTKNDNYNLTWYFDHGCFQNIVTFDPSINQAKDSLVGDVNIDIIVNFIRPKAWFWKLKWNKSKWKSETNVFNNCNELNIKENTIIEIK